MRALARIIAVIMIIAIIISFVGYMMDWKKIDYAVPVNVFIFILLLASAIYNKHLENKKFRKFLQKVKQEQILKNENQRETAHSSRVKTGNYFQTRSRKIGLIWTGGTVHGAVPKRRERRIFLSRR